MSFIIRKYEDMDVLSALLDERNKLQRELWIDRLKRSETVFSKWHHTMGT